MKYVKSIIALIIFSLALAANAFTQEEPQPAPTPAVAPQTVAAPTAEPKREGVARIGLVVPKTPAVAGNPAAGVDVSASVRDSFTSYLSGPTVETLLLEARTPAQINVEAQQKGCDFVLYVSVTQKKKTSLFGNFIRIAAPAIATPAPVSGEPAEPAKGNVAGAAQQAGQSVLVAAAAGSVKAKDVVTLEYSLLAVNAKAPLVKNSVKAKANADGEDVLSPLIEEAATTITNALVKQ